MDENIINEYGYCGFRIKVMFSDGNFSCISDPVIKDIVIHQHAQQHAAEDDIEEEIDKYIQNNQNLFGGK